MIDKIETYNRGRGKTETKFYSLNQLVSEDSLENHENKEIFYKIMRDHREKIIGNPGIQMLESYFRGGLENGN